MSSGQLGFLYVAQIEICPSVKALQVHYIHLTTDILDALKSLYFKEEERNAQNKRTNVKRWPTEFSAELREN